MQKELQLKTLSSLAKVFPNKIVGLASKRCDAVCGEEVSFQIAFNISERKYAQLDYELKVSSPLEKYISLYRVGNVPSMLPVYPDRTDSGYITLSPSIFPDPLFPLENNTVTAAVMNRRALWVSCKIPKDMPAGDYPVEVSFMRNGELKAKTKYTITVHAITLPENKLLYTQWFHCDCIADIHKVPVLSEKHWALIGNYMKLAAEHGMNMILTPVVTPPLDTEVGTERPTVQLVEVTKTDDAYSFDFTLLKRFVDMARSCGINNFEISHFFTQWGANFAPKVVANVNGKRKKIFGWNTSATSADYADFLRALVPELIAFFESLGVDKKALYFHVSDEPREAHLDSYRAAADILCPLIEGCHHIDALSAFDFYKLGLVSTPVVATNHITPYLEANVDGLWCYYCCSQCQKVSNRFFAMPSPRTRSIGVQMYKYDIAGFLQWGYNFYYTQLSRRMVDPYKETDGGEAFPSGDAFTVYPYRDGAIPSIRQKVFAQALNDIRLLKLLEERIGKEKVVEELDRIMGTPLTFDTCATDEKFFDELYKTIFSYLG